MFRAAFLLALCFALGIGKPAPSASDDVERQTASALRALSLLPAHCTAGLPSLIESEKLKTFGNFDNCNITGIINNFAYMLIDSADFGGIEYRAIRAIVDSNAVCVAGHKSTGDKIECVINELMSQNMYDVLQALRVYVYQLEDLIAAVVKELRECRGDSLLQYQLFLDDLLKTAQKC